MKLKPRKHQLEAMQIVDEIAGGADIRDVLCACTPGAGKSQLPVIFGKLIDLGFADAICWICPRKSLQIQGETGFQDPIFRKMFDHQLSIRSATNDVDPCRGLNGFTTTYQAAGVDKAQTILTEIRSKRYILILDEHHHIETESLWEDSIRPIYEAAVFRIEMTGTLERNSGHKIAFTPYVTALNGKFTQPDLSPDKGRVIMYSRRDALAERAIIPLAFHFNDASVEWREEDGSKRSYDSLTSVGAGDTGKAIFTALSTTFAKELITMALDHWKKHLDRDPDAKVLVVTAGIKQARKAVKYLKERFMYADIATSHETKEAQSAIRAFKAGRIKILVTIAMAYEGLDCPTISHLVNLTNTRSTPWIIQMLARVVRVNRGIPYEDQRAHIFTPDDPLMHDIVMKLEAEQLPFVSKKPHSAEQIELFEPSENEAEYKPYNIDPLDSALTDGRTFILGGHWPDPDQDIEVEEVEEVITPSDTEQGLRKQIDSIVKDYCRIYKYKPQVANREIRAYFGKPRSEMRIPELQAVLRYAQSTYTSRGQTRRRSVLRVARRLTAEELRA